MNKENSYSKKKLTFLIPLLIIIAIALGISGYHFYIQYSTKKLLDSAKAYEGIGDYKKAIEQYTNYLIKKPDDINTKYEL